MLLRALRAGEAHPAIQRGRTCQVGGLLQHGVRASSSKGQILCNLCKPLPAIDVRVNLGSPCALLQRCDIARMTVGPNPFVCLHDMKSRAVQTCI